MDNVTQIHQAPAATRTALKDVPFAIASPLRWADESIEYALCGLTTVALALQALNSEEGSAAHHVAVVIEKYVTEQLCEARAKIQEAQQALDAEWGAS